MNRHIACIAINYRVIIQRAIISATVAVIRSFVLIEAAEYSIMLIKKLVREIREISNSPESLYLIFCSYKISLMLKGGIGKSMGLMEINSG